MKDAKGNDILIGSVVSIKFKVIDIRDQKADQGELRLELCDNDLMDTRTKVTFNSRFVDVVSTPAKATAASTATKPTPQPPPPPTKPLPPAPQPKKEEQHGRPSR